MKEGKDRHKAAFSVVVVGGVLITAAIITLYSPWLQVFDLREIVVSGNQRVSASEVAQAADLRSGQSLLAIPLRALAERVSLLPWVHDVSVRRAFPHTICIHLSEREPIARVSPASGGACVLLGAGGVVVEDDCAGSEAEFLVIGAALSGIEPGYKLLDSRLVEFLEGLRRADLRGVHVREVEVSDMSSIRLEADHGLRILLGDLDGIMAQLGALASLCRTINAADYQLIDLRWGGGATLVPR